jgi:hypothetical protein
MDIAAISMGAKRLGLGVEQPSPFSVEVKNE